MDFLMALFGAVVLAAALFGALAWGFYLGYRRCLRESPEERQRTAKEWRIEQWERAA